MNSHDTIIEALKTKINFIVDGWWFRVGNKAGSSNLIRKWDRIL